MLLHARPLVPGRHQHADAGRNGGRRGYGPGGTLLLGQPTVVAPQGPVVGRNARYRDKRQQATVARGFAIEAAGKAGYFSQYSYVAISAHGAPLRQQYTTPLWFLTSMRSVVSRNCKRSPRNVQAASNDAGVNGRIVRPT